MVFALWLILGISSLHGSDAFDEYDDDAPPAPYTPLTHSAHISEEENEFSDVDVKAWQADRSKDSYSQEESRNSQELFSSDEEHSLLGKISRSGSPAQSDDEYEERCLYLHKRSAKNVEDNELLKKCLRTLSPQAKENFLTFLQSDTYEQRIVGLSRQVKSTAQEILIKTLNDRPEKVAQSIEDLQASFFITDYAVQCCIFEFLTDCIFNGIYDRLTLFIKDPLFKQSPTPLEAMDKELRYYFQILESVNVSKVSCKHLREKQPLIKFTDDHRKKMARFIRFGLDFYLEQYRNKSTTSVTTEYLGRGSETQKFFDKWLADSKDLFIRLFGSEYLNDLNEITDVCSTEFKAEQETRLASVQAVFAAPSVAGKAVASGVKSGYKKLTKLFR